MAGILEGLRAVRGVIGQLFVGIQQVTVLGRFLLWQAAEGGVQSDCPQQAMDLEIGVIQQYCPAGGNWRQG